MISRAVTEDCQNAFGRREHICFGISPFNSYFSESRIQQLALWGQKEFQSMHFFLPDIPSIFTLEALGYDTEKARWKARRQSQYLVNKITKALFNIGINADSTSNMILNWEFLNENQTFQNLHQDTLGLFENDAVFRSACIEATSWVLEGRFPPGVVPSEEQKAHAVKYLLAEIPLFLDTAGIVGVTSSVFSYHQCISFIEELISGKFKCKRNQSQGFLVLHSAQRAQNVAQDVREAQPLPMIEA